MKSAVSNALIRVVSSLFLLFTLARISFIAGSSAITHISRTDTALSLLQSAALTPNNLARNRYLRSNKATAGKGVWIRWNGMVEWTGLDWTGLDWTGLEWTGMEWNGMIR